MSNDFQQDDLSLWVSTCVKGGTGTITGGASYTTTNSRQIAGWTRVRVSRGIERCPSDFEVEFTEPFASVDSVIVQPGDEVEVYLGADLVLSGFVDRYMPSYNAREHTIRVTGRSKCQDLVDCSANWPGGQMLNLPILQIAKNLCDAYGIPVNLAAGTNQGLPIAQTIVMAGEPVYDVIERICRYLGLLVYDQPDGSLLLSGIGTQQAACGFQEGVNVLAAGAMYSMDGRFSDYEGLYQGLDTLQDIGDGGNQFAHVVDSGVPRYRRRVVICEQISGSYEVATQRVNWELARRMGRSFQVRVTTDSWRDSAGQLWQPNTLVPLDLPGLKMHPQTWLIADVTYKRDETGTTAELVIMPPQAFAQEPIVLNPINADITPVS